MKLKEYATKIKNRLMGQNAKPQKEEKGNLSEKIAERTQELIKEDGQEAVRKAVAEAPEPEETAEPQKEELNTSNNRRKMEGMPMIRAKALEKARKNKRRKPKK